jgi:predicted HNH restriction endonuclease
MKRKQPMKRLPYTPSSKIRAALRQLYLRSRERAAALKASGYCCERCGVKQSRAKGREVYVEVHHRAGILNWKKVFEFIRAELLVGPEKLEVLCKECHKEEHEEQAIKQEGE